jgi:imidazolonepropionase-like amidohydrolase
MNQRRACVLFVLLPTLLALAGLSSFGQVKPAVGLHQNTPSVHAFTNARIVVSPGNVIEKGTLVIRDGTIAAVGAKVEAPADARVWDCTGLTIYPGFIDGYSDVGVPKKPSPAGGQDQDQAPPKPPEPRGPKHWNEYVLSSQNADDLFMPDAKAAEKLRGMGFTTALVVPQKGIFRGSSAVFDLGEGTPNDLLVRPHVAQHVTFESSRGDAYPNSLIGTIALIRQTFLDAQWFRSAMEAAAKNPGEPRPEYVADLAALEDAVTAKQPVVFESTDEMSLLRAARIAKEFSLKILVRGSGYEFRRLDAVKQTGLPVILPVNFPEAPSVQSPEDALNAGLEELRSWDEAPGNPKILHDAGITFALTTATLKDPGNFLANVRKAIERGLPRDAALAALTTVPAKLYGVDHKTGTLGAGKLANFVVTDGDIFGEKTVIHETWVDGKRYQVKPKPDGDPRGTWKATLTGAPVNDLTILVKGEASSPQGSVKGPGKEIKATTTSFSNLLLQFSFNGDSVGLDKVIRMSGTIQGNRIVGTGELPDGKMFTWSADRTDKFKPEPDTSKAKPPSASSFGTVYPPGAFGRAKTPDQPAHLIIKDATVWTCGPQGTLEHADVLVSAGKISKVGQHLTAPADAVVINGTGMNITPGLIDCHSHTGVAGSVNESGSAITAEVRIGDALDPDDIALYRELAGGLTVAHVLHGSANPIGGQCQPIKLRWGALPEDMKFEGAAPTIKFALGENVKQSNWGDKYTTRYPQTREGVEQIIRDEFRAAVDYERTWKDYQAGKTKIPPRRDLRLEAISEVLHGKRIVHCHSYRQDEIEMLMRVAEEFGFHVGTFQHVLEGYKVADQMAAHGAGGSTFSDWWAYKFEVYDAIPYNGALMHDEGVVVSFNSDSDELARRLNTEAAKAVKYGGLSQEEALKFVTINPAKQLHVEKRVGSLEAGKDADFVVWNGNPLSTYSICEQTWIDGRKYFDRDEDRKMNEEVTHERSALIQKILQSNKSGSGAGKVTASSDQADEGSRKEPYSCKDESAGKERP